LVRLFRTNDYLFKGIRYERLEREFRPELRELADEYAERARRVAAINSLYGDWEVTLERPSN
jgi:hypothetical protein